MATSTLYLYKDTKLKDKKNFSIDYISDYLSPFQIGSAITNYQYQRMTLYKKIKLNSDQVNCSVNYLLENTKPNYVKFVQDSVTSGGVTKTCVYYYFVESITQISEKTIELDLKMDVLNTFNYNRKDTNNTNYVLSDRSLITREHKDRWKVEKVYEQQYPDSDDVDIYETIRDYQTNDDAIKDSSITINLPAVNDYIDTYNLNNLIIYLYDPVTDPPGHPAFSIRIYRGPDRYWDYSGSSDEDEGYRIDHLRFENGILSIENVENDVLDSIDYTNEEQVYNYQVCIIMPATSTTNFAIYDVSETWYNIFTNLFMNTQIVIQNNAYVRIIDQFEEGIDAITFKQPEETMLLDSSQLNQWYVVFRSANGVVQNPNDTQALYVNPVRVQFYSDDGYSLTSQLTPVKKTLLANDKRIPQIKNVGEFLYINLQDLGPGAYIEINNVQYNNSGISYLSGGITYTLYHLWIRRKNNNDITFTSAVASLYPYFDSLNVINYFFAYNFDSVSFYDVNSVSVYTGFNDGSYGQNVSYYGEITIGSGTTSVTETSSPFSSLDLTDPKLIKIINFPYCPREDLPILNLVNISDELQFNQTDGCLELVNPQQNSFNRNLWFSGVNPMSVLFHDTTDDFSSITYNKTRKKIYESKLYNSNYYQPKFVYDSFSFIFRLEDVDERNTETYSPNFVVQYVCSGNVQSKFMFKFNQYICKREEQDYNDVLIINRNNEKAIYNNAYINYIKSGGFNYDTKSADTQNLVNGVTIALSTIGAVASFVSSIWTGGVGVAAGVGLVAGTATKVTSSIHTAQQNDRQIAQKLLSNAQQSTSVSTSEDIDILKAYTNNKAKLCLYKVSDYMEDALWDLFHYFGYKCNYYGIPNINTRCNFNFVQGDVIMKNYTFNDDIANEIMKKWKEGITFFHKRANNTWDIDQEKENFENALL